MYGAAPPTAAPAPATGLARRADKVFIMAAMHTDPFQRLGLDREVLTVSQLNQRARHLLEDVFPQVWIEGERPGSYAAEMAKSVHFTTQEQTDNTLGKPELILYTLNLEEYG